MNILVCVKQVPDTTEIRIDPVTNTLIRAGVASIVNPFDTYALEMAARIKEQTGDGYIVLLSMGPMQAKAALTECLAKGGDQAYLVSDRKFGGADTLATSFTLQQAIQTIEEREHLKFDVIFCGKQAIDGDTAQVGPEIAEILDYPQVTNVIEAEAGPGKLRVKKEQEDGYDVIDVTLPCLLTATKPGFEPRRGTLLTKIAARRREIRMLDAKDLELSDSDRIGLKGSPTKVKKTFTPPQKTGGRIIKEPTERESVMELMNLLRKDPILGSLEEQL